MRSFRPYSSIPSLPCNKVWAEIDVGALANNFKILRSSQPDSRMICVVKADAYGHTSAICVDTLLEAGCDFFAVSCIEEAIEVRRLCQAKGIGAEILILGYTNPLYAYQLAEYDIIQTAVSEEHAASLEIEASRANCRLRIHVALDTGMNRIGICARNENECLIASKKIKALTKSSSLSVEGIFTHFSQADEEDSEVFSQKSFTKAQFERFMTVRKLLLSDGIKLFSHVCNSAATARFSEYSLDGVRVGISLYGISPSKHVKVNTSPVMSLHTVISHVHKLQKGEKVSYGGKYEADTDKTIATLPIGYADGFLRAYSGFHVTVHTQDGDAKAPVIGRICMDQCMIDVTGIPVNVGDRITVFGTDLKDISVLARLSGSIEYEVLCLVSGRVPRIVRKAFFKLFAIPKKSELSNEDTAETENKTPTNEDRNSPLINEYT